jgi:hypothetical protein
MGSLCRGLVLSEVSNRQKDVTLQVPVCLEAIFVTKPATDSPPVHWSQLQDVGLERQPT